MDERLIPVRDAITARSLTSLTAAINRLVSKEGTDGAHKLIHRFIIPSLDHTEINWFWNSIASPAKSEHVLSLILKDAALLLIKRGHTIGQDFSFSNGKRRLLLSESARRTLEEALPRRKLVMLSLVTLSDHVNA